MFGLIDSITKAVVNWVSSKGAAWVNLRDSLGNEITQLGAGPYPQSWVLNVEYPASNAASWGPTPDLTNYSKFTIVISGLTTDTVAISGNIGTNQEIATNNLLPINATTGALAAAVALTNGTYRLIDLALRTMTFTKTGVADATVVITLMAKA